MAAQIEDPVVWIGKRGFPPSSQSRQIVYVRYILARFRVLPVTLPPKYVSLIQGIIMIIYKKKGGF